MDPAVSFGLLVYGLSALSGIGLAAVVWSHRRKPGAKPLLGSIAGGSVWSVSLFLAYAFAGQRYLSVFIAGMFLGAGVVVASVFVFALEYTGRTHLVTRRRLALFAIEPAVMVPLAYLNPGDLFASVTVNPSTSANVAISFGPLFWVHTTYSYILVGVGWLFLVGMLYRTRSIYRGQVVALILAIVVPTVANIVTILRIVEFSAAPIGFTVANGLFALAIIRYRLVDLAPIARDRVVENVSEAVVVVDTEDRIIDVNPTARELLEPDVERDPIGMSVLDLVEPIPGAADGYRDIVAGETAQSYELAFDGEYYEGYASPIEDGRDRIVGWLFLVRDVTEQRQREKELERRNEQLDRFAGVVSHDLRNPLNVASGRAELIRETGDLTHLDDLIDAHDRMATIVDDVLALSREGEAVTDPAPVDLRAVAEAAWQSIESDDARLDVVADARLEADRDRLVRLFENLFRNALEHGRGDDGGEESAASGRALTVEVGTIPSSSGGVRGIYVADDGVGIPDDDRESVFESGYSTSDEGTGFGLAIVSEIADAHDWSVAVAESEVGGARFEFCGVETADE